MGEFLFRSPGLHDLQDSWSSYKYLKHREYGGLYRQDTVTHNYYKYMNVKPIIDQDASHGSVFNTEFSPNGKVLIAACERSSFLIFDPLNQKLLLEKNKAHDDGINCIRFIDSNNFLTCSDDKTIALWDLRNLKSRIYLMVGHTNWVKSIEYCRNSKLLVTSAFDDTVRVWDLNKPARCGFVEGKVVLRIARLTRMKLTPCSTKMIISSIAGNLVIIHNLDLHNLSQSSEHGLPFWTMCGTTQQRAYLLSSNGPWTMRNKFEIIEEFPEGVLPWCISSLEVHPHGWCAVIRYSSGEWHQEWTAVYDVQTPIVDASDPNKPLKPKRLIYSIAEPNLARGYIKEPCFSSDGRIIGSPFGNTTRLLTFNKNCDELPKCVQKKPCQLTDFKTLCGHKHPVLTCSFSPTHPLLSSGCRGGKVAFFYPHV